MGIRRHPRTEGLLPLSRLCALGALLRNKIGYGRQTSRQRVGTLGEQAAVRLLKKKGLRVLARNWRKGILELDIVAREGHTLVFVEVRTRKAGARVSGYHSITRHKKRSLLRACKAYLKDSRDGVATLRFDVVEVKHGPEDRLELNHFANIPLFPKNFHKPTRYG